MLEEHYKCKCAQFSLLENVNNISLFVPMLYLLIIVVSSCIQELYKNDYTNVIGEGFFISNIASCFLLTLNGISLNSVINPVVLDLVYIFNC